MYIMTQLSGRVNPRFILLSEPSCPAALVFFFGSHFATALMFVGGAGFVGVTGIAAVTSRDLSPSIVVDTEDTQ